MRATGKLWGIAVAVCAAGALATPVHAQATRYLPEDAEAILTINIRQILEAKLVKDNQPLVDLLKAELEKEIKKKDGDLGALLKEMDFDLFRDSNTLTVASAGGKDPAKVWVIFSGNFNPQKASDGLANFARKHGDKLKVVPQAGTKTLYELIPPQADKEHGFMALANNKDLVITANLDTLKQALRQGEPGSLPALKKELQALIAKDKENQSLSFVSTRNAIQKLIKESNNPQGPAAAAVVEKLDSVSGTITLGADIQLQVTVVAKDADTAKEITKQATQGLFLANLVVQQQAQQNPQLAPLVDVVKSLRVSNMGNSLIATGRVTPEVIQQGLKMIRVPQP